MIIMAKTKKKASSTSSTNKNLLRKLALDKIFEHNRDYLKLDITIPLGNKALKQVHTNQWLFTNLPKDFDLANWTILAKALNSSANRYEGYVKNRWYIESNDITVNANGKAEMKLGLNAFASTHSTYAQQFRDLSKAYTSATTTTSASKNTTNAVDNGELIKQSWVKKYNTTGVNGLKDGRGRNKSENELSELEKLQAEIKILKAEKKRQQMEIDLLKKLEEIERR